MSAEDRSPKGRGPQHTTHHDDCGCLTARYEAMIATLEAACRKLEWDAAEAMALVLDGEGRVATLEGERARLVESVAYWKGLWERFAEDSLKAQAHTNALRDALERIAKAHEDAAYDSEAQRVAVFNATAGWARAALSATPAQSLAASRADTEQGWREAHMMVATANALRDALEDVLNNATCACYEDGEPGHCPRCAVAYQEARTALAQTPAQALAAHNAEVLERAATCAESYLWNPPAIQSQAGANCGDAIRALAAQAATHSVPDGTSEVKP